MQELKLITNELMPVYETSTGEKVVNARELHEGLEVGKDFSNWIKARINKYDFTENEDYILLANSGDQVSQGGHNRKDYILKLDMAKELAMVENNKQGRKARKYFIEVEKRFNENKSNSISFNKEKIELRIKNNNSKARMVNSALRLLKAKTLSEEERKLILSQTVNGFLEVQQNEAKRKTYTAAEIGLKLGISANKVGRLASGYDLKTEQYGEWYKDKCKHSNKEVDSFRYYENVIDFLKGKISDE